MDAVTVDTSLPAQPFAAGSFDSLRASQLPEGTILPDDFYLTKAGHKDVDAVSNLIGKKGFFFAPLSDLTREGANPFVAASKVMFGETVKEAKFTLAVRARNDDRLLGCVTFSAPQDRSQTSEISYFFDPTLYQRTLGTQSVLRAMHWLIHQGGYQKLKIRKLKATVDPNNTASIKILDKIGLEVIRRGFTLPDESPYRGPNGEKRPRLLLEGNVPADIIPSLERSLSDKRYSLQTPVVV
jgi:RimJ/RimL family protein N-acetyltransferase